MSGRTGSCLCGGMAFEVSGDLPGLEVCWCRSCQKAQGSAFVAVLPVAEANVVFLRGEDLLAAYPSSPGKERLFCKVCGSPVLSRSSALPGRLRLRAGLIEGGLGVQIASHAFTGQAVDWCVVDGEAPRYDGARPS